LSEAGDAFDSDAAILDRNAFFATCSAHRQNARALKVISTSWCRMPLPPLTRPRSRMTQYVPLLMRANFASRK
jgi:hypothetical protein